MHFFPHRNSERFCFATERATHAHTYTHTHKVQCLKVRNTKFNKVFRNDRDIGRKGENTGKVILFLFKP